MKYINEDEKFWKHSYRVHLHQLDADGLLVNADCDQDALDYAVDYAEQKGWEGIFVDEADIERKDENEIDIIRAGNHCKPLNSWEVTITQLD